MRAHQYHESVDIKVRDILDYPFSPIPAQLNQRNHESPSPSYCMCSLTRTGVLRSSLLRNSLSQKQHINCFLIDPLSNRKTIHKKPAGGDHLLRYNDMRLPDHIFYLTPVLLIIILLSNWTTDYILTTLCANQKSLQS